MTQDPGSTSTGSEQSGPPRDEADLRNRHRPGTPAGISLEGVEARSRIASVLTREAFPGSRDDLLAVAGRSAADDDVVAMLRRLPEGSYERVQDVADALGLGHEERREGD